MKITTLILSLPEEKATQLIEEIHETKQGYISFQGTYEERPHHADAKPIVIRYEEDDTKPIALCKSDERELRPLGVKEWDSLVKDASVSQILLYHPRADKYGAPIPAIQAPDVHKAFCSNLGLQPTKNIDIIARDTQDDTTGHYIITLLADPKTAKAIEKKTQDIQNKMEFGDITDLGPQALETTLEDVSTKLQEKLKEFKASNSRNPKLADEIDKLSDIQIILEETN